jgi:hypothetical protein
MCLVSADVQVLYQRQLDKDVKNHGARSGGLGLGSDRGTITRVKRGKYKTRCKMQDARCGHHCRQWRSVNSTALQVHVVNGIMQRDRGVLGRGQSTSQTGVT